MPMYTYVCDVCGMVFDYIECLAKRNEAQHCPGCNGPASRNMGLEHIDQRQIPEHERYSNSMGVNPEQIKEAEKNFPGSQYTPDGRLIIHNRQHKLQEMKRRGMEEL